MPSFSEGVEDEGLTKTGHDRDRCMARTDKIRREAPKFFCLDRLVQSYDFFALSYGCLMPYRRYTIMIICGELL